MADWNPRPERTPRHYSIGLIAGALLLAGVTTASAQPAVTFYTDEAAWTAAVSAAAVDAFDTTGVHVALSDEVVSVPAQDGQLGSQLTFRAQNTGLCASFTLQTLEAGAGITFEDGEPSPSNFFTGTLSIGDIDDFEDDDFQLTFPTRSVYAVGLTLVSNSQSASEHFEAFGANGKLGTLDGLSIPGGSPFVGVVAKEPLVSVRFDEDPDGDDMAIRDFRFGCAHQDPDADGLSNLAERRAGTDPNDSDTDDDGLLDGAEIGTGNFGSQQVISTLADDATSVFAADVDGDGDTDVLSASYSDNKIAWYENLDGAGSFGVEQPISDLPSFGARSVYAADVDGDGDIDVLSTDQVESDIAWFENTDGEGSFGGSQLISSSTPGARIVVTADLDGDGDADVLGAAGQDTGPDIAWFENTDGEGSFGAEQGITDFADQVTSIVAADLDGDGDPDVLSTSTLDGDIAWYENTDGAGSFGTEQLVSGSVTGARSVFAVDMDGDGDLDVVSGADGVATDTIAWYENTDGVGTFGTEQVISTLADSPTSVFAADVDGDGDPDVVSASGTDDEIAWYENTDGAGNFGPQQIISILADSAESVFVADVDGDGDLDVISASGGDDKIAWYEQTNVADPLDPDTDGDGLCDGSVTVGACVGNESAAGTNRLDPDSDGDGLSDGDEVVGFADPLDPDSDDDGVCDGGLTGGGACTAGPDACPLDSGSTSSANSDAHPAGDDCQCGDVSNDGVIDATDLVRIREHIVGATVSGTFVSARCSVDGLADDCDVVDAFKLQRYLGGKSNALSMVCTAYSN